MFTVPSGGGDVVLRGTVGGGTIVDPSGALTANGGTLSGVTYDGALNVSGASSSSLLFVSGGLTLKNAAGTGNGTATVGLAGGYYGVLVFDDTQTINNATINMIGNKATAAATTGQLPTTIRPAAARPS